MAVDTDNDGKTVQAGARTMSVIEVRLKPAMLARYNLPDILYPMSLAAFDAALSGDGDWPLASVLYQLQSRAREGGADWQNLEPAMERLAQILAPDDPRPVLAAAANEWWLEVGPVDLEGPIVTIQRGDNLIAAISSTDGGRLRVASYRPLDAKSATYLIDLAVKPHAEHGVCMRANNWEYALDCSAGNGNFYAFTRGEAYLSYWEGGLAQVSDGSVQLKWSAMKSLLSNLPSIVVAELGIYYSHASEDTFEQHLAAMLRAGCS